MILAEKISNLRKKNGWSQEELATQLSVSRQSVSKWESGQSVPDLDKLLTLSRLFGVTLDYLVKDEISCEEIQYAAELPEDNLPHVSVEEANHFLADTAEAAKQIALGTSICILSPIILLLLGGFSEAGRIPVTEDMAGGIGVGILLIMVAAAIPLFIKNGIRLERYKHITEHGFITEYGVESIARDRMNKFSGKYTNSMISGTVIIILGVIPLIVAGGFGAQDTVLIMFLCLLLVLVSIAVNIFIRTSMVNDSYKQLLQEGDYSAERKARNRRWESVGTIYWCIVTAVYLAISLHNNNWGESWIIWPVAGVLFAALCGVLNLLSKDESN